MATHEGPARLFPGERSGSSHPFVGGAGTQLRSSNVLPSHPFIQDPTMPPNPAPSPLIQLEEVRRRLEEEKIKSGTMHPKQRSEVTAIVALLLQDTVLEVQLQCVFSPLRYVMEVIQRGRSAVRPPMFPPLTVAPAVSDSEPSEPECVLHFLAEIVLLRLFLFTDEE